MTYTVAALYKFTPVADTHAVRGAIRLYCENNGILGTLILAGEGINGTVAGSAQGIDGLLQVLAATLDFEDAEVKLSTASEKPFKRLKLKIKPEIVTIRNNHAAPLEKIGQYVAPEDWNALISRPDVITIDTRNTYETEAGVFAGALDPKTDQFVQFPEFVEKNMDALKGKTIAMYCTGGIRCEKASSYMMGMGFENVYHLKGGILKYLETVPPEQSLWEGQCFVFDERESLGHGLAEKKIGWYRKAENSRT